MDRPVRAARRRRSAVAAWVAGAAALLLAYPAWITVSTPAVDSLADSVPARTGFMRFRAAGGAPASGASPARPVPLGSISPLLACAVVKAEDRAFFRHRGFEWGQLRKVAARGLRGDAVMGGSTITQQLARNLYLTPERTLDRKLREAVIARRLDRALSKRRTLEIYLNVIEWGDGVWGAEAASRHYFGKGAGELDAFEATFLAALVAAPRSALAGRNADRAQSVQYRVLDQLYVSGLIDAEAWSGASLHALETFADLAAGVPLAEALRGGGEAPSDLPLPPRGAPAPLPLPRALAEECGLARELAGAGAAVGR